MSGKDGLLLHLQLLHLQLLHLQLLHLLRLQVHLQLPTQQSRTRSQGPRHLRTPKSTAGLTA